VLLVEDHDDARDMLGMLLGKLGYEVHTAADGPAGLDAALELQPDVAVVDVTLPGLDGYEVARRVRAAGGRQPILVSLTGHASPEDEARARAAGFDAHLSKPVDVQRLVALLESVPDLPAS
jgi:two-component system, sensor histidine kinase